MPDTSEHRNKLCCLIFFCSTNPTLIPLSIPTDATVTVLLNVNKQCLKYSTFCTLSTIFFFFFSQNLTMYSAVYFPEKSLSLSLTSVKSSSKPLFKSWSWQYPDCTACQTSLQIRCLTDHPEPSYIWFFATTRKCLCNSEPGKWEDARKPLLLVKAEGLTDSKFCKMSALHPNLSKLKIT